MAPHQGQAVGSLLPRGGPLDSSATSFLLNHGVGVIELSKAVIITIVALSLVGFFIVPLLLFRCFLRPKSTPLPPKQPLAYHRGRESRCFPYPYIPRKRMRFDQVGCYGNGTSSLRPSRVPSFRYPATCSVGSANPPPPSEASGTRQEDFRKISGLQNP